MHTLIRPIQIEDNVPLAKIIRNVFEEYDAPRSGTVYSDPTTDNLYELFQTPGAACWVAENENEVLGCSGIYPTAGLPPNYAELAKFYLAKNARGKGIGKELMEKCFQSAKSFRYTHLYLESLPHFDKYV